MESSKKPKLIGIKSKLLELVIIKINKSLLHPLFSLTDMTAREVISYVL